MKKTVLLLFLFSTRISVAQLCDPNIHFRTLGTSGNMLSMLVNRVNPLAYDSATHSLVFIHRNNNVAFGGTTGDLRYDVSSDTGNTWTINQGILNPTVNSLNGARYPQVAIKHPSTAGSYTGNYLVYYAPTTNGTNYNGYVSGVRKLNNTGNTEHYNQVSVNNPYVPGGMCQGAANTYWTVDINYDPVTTGYGAIRILKGVYNSGDITWSLNKSLTPAYNTGYDGTAQVADWNIAFDPSGQKGWVVLLTHLTTAGYQFHPVFYKTTNGGTSWTGPIEVDLNSFTSVLSLVPGGSYATTAFQCDLSVDASGNPHALVQVGSGDGLNYSIIVSNLMSMFDIHFKNGSWLATELFPSQSLRGYYGNGGQNFSHDSDPQASRSLNGDVIAFTWTDTQGALGGANDYPNLYGKFYSTSSNTYSTLYDFTSCTGFADQIIYPRMSPTLISKGNGKYQLPIVFAKVNASGNEMDPPTYYFIDDLVVNACSFSSFVATISASGPTSFCAGDSVILSVNGSYNSYLWSNGATTATLAAKQSGAYKVTVSNGNGCTDASNTINVTITGAPTVSISPVGNLQFCPGSSVQLNATAPLAVNFKWKKNGVTIAGATASSYMATASGTYTCVATNSCGSQTSNGLVVTKLTAPTATVTPSGTVSICQGDSALLTANTVSNATYKWYKGSNAISGATSQTYKAFTAANYKVKITKTTTGCSTTSAPTTVQITCREQALYFTEKVEIFPNPSTGRMSFTIETDQQDCDITVYSSMGQVVLTTQAAMNHGTGTLDLSPFPKGIYHLTFGLKNKEILSRRMVLH